MSRVTVEELVLGHDGQGAPAELRISRNRSDHTITVDVGCADCSFTPPGLEAVLYFLDQFDTAWGGAMAGPTWLLLRDRQRTEFYARLRTLPQGSEPVLELGSDAPYPEMSFPWAPLREALQEALEHQAQGRDAGG